MTLHQLLFLHLLFPTLNHFLNPPYHHWVVDHLIETKADGNNLQPTTLELANTETVMSGNDDIDTPPPQDISNLFAAADLPSQS